MTELRTPLSKVKGHGSSKSGTGHFWMQRLTAIAMVPLVIWLTFSVASLPSMDHAAMQSWLGGPFNAAMMILVFAVGFFHMKLGLQVVIEDYVSDHGVRTGLIIAVTFAAVLLGVIGILGVIRIIAAAG